MRLTVGQRLFWTVLLVTAALIVAVIVATSFAIRHGLTHYLLHANIGQLDGLVRRLEGHHARHGNWNAIADAPDSFVLLAFEAVREIEARPERRVLADVERGSLLAPARDRFFLPPVDRFNQATSMVLLDADGQYIAGRAIKPGDQRVQRTLQVGGALVGFLAIGMPSLRSPADDAFIRQSMRLLLLIGALGLASCAAAAWLLRRNLVHPINALVAGTHRLASGDYSSRIDLKRRDELGDLVRDFNRLADALERHEASRRQWVADTSHELRTPLTILRAKLEALRDNVLNASPAALDNLLRETVQMARLVDDLHELARADAGGLALHREEIDPVALLEEVVAGFAPRLHAHPLALELVLPAAHGALFADANRLHQLMANLIDNTLRYTAPGGRARLTVRPEAGWCVIALALDPALEAITSVYGVGYRLDVTTVDG